MDKIKSKGLFICVIFIAINIPVIGKINYDKIREDKRIRTIQKIVEVEDGIVVFGDMISESHASIGVIDFDSLNLFLLKIDFSGKEIWLKIFGEKNNRDFPEDMINDSKGNFLLLSNINTYKKHISVDSFHTVLHKVDKYGNLLWKNKYTGTYTTMNELPDSNYILSGTQYNGYDNPVNPLTLEMISFRKIKSNSEIVWEKKYFPATDPWSSLGNGFLKVINTKDRNIIFVFKKITKDKDTHEIPGTNLYFSYYIGKLDLNGNLISQVKINEEKATSLDTWNLTKDEKLIVPSFKVIYNKPGVFLSIDTVKYYINKISSKGNVLWSKYLTYRCSGKVFNTSKVFELSDDNIAFVYNYVDVKKKESGIIVMVFDKEGKEKGKKEFVLPGNYFEYTEPILLKNGNIFIISTYYSHNKSNNNLSSLYFTEVNKWW